MYEVLLSASLSVHSSSFINCANDASRILLHFKHRTVMPVEMQENMREIKNAVHSEKNKLDKCKIVLTEIMEDVENLALMNLSILKTNSNLYT
jgi:hypothetical protein